MEFFNFLNAHSPFVTNVNDTNYVCTKWRSVYSKLSCQTRAVNVTRQGENDTIY